jgi:hypothetical protein
MICSVENGDEYRDFFRPRTRERVEEPSGERFRTGRVIKGPRTNKVRRRKRQPLVGGLYRRRIKKVV